MFKSLPKTSWLKVSNEPPVFRTGLPDFVDMGLTNVWPWDGCAKPMDRLRAFVERYDYARSKEITLEPGFRGSVRILPAMPHIIGETDEDVPAPYGGYPFNRDPELLDACNELILAILPQFQFPTQTKWICTSIQLTGMQPGVFLKPHIDGYWPHLLAEKVHLPITTNSRCRQLVFDTDTCLVKSMYHLKPGGIYAINNLEPHSAINFGDEVRWHCIVDVVEQNSWENMKMVWKRDWPEHDTPYSVNPPATVKQNEEFFERFLNVHGTLEPRRYAHSLLSNVPYYTRQNERVTNESSSS